MTPLTLSQNAFLKIAIILAVTALLFLCDTSKTLAGHDINTTKWAMTVYRHLESFPPEQVTDGDLCRFRRFIGPIDFNFGEGALARACGDDHFAIRFEKFIKPHPGNYTIETCSDDGIRVFLDGNLIVDSWEDRGYECDDPVEINLNSKLHHLRVEYYENGGDARVCFGISPSPGSGLCEEE